MGTETDSDRIDAAIARLADRQHGVIARRQLVAMGVSGRAIVARLARRLLVPLHRGVYAFGHRQLRNEGEWLAAVLAAGPNAALSHRDAAALHGLRKPPEGKISVTTPAHSRTISGVWLHARRALSVEDVTTVAAIPVTSVPRTLVDLAPMLTAAGLAATLGEAERRDLLDLAAVEAALRRVRGRHGQGHSRLAAALDAHNTAGAALLRSPLEERFLDLLIAAKLPRPRLNVRVDGAEVDALWEQQRVIAELDGWAHHSGRRAATRDREKTNRLQLKGYVVLRFLHGDVVGRPAEVAAAIAEALSAACGT